MSFLPLLYLAPFIIIALISAYYKARSNRVNKIFNEAAPKIGLKHKKYWSPIMSGDVNGKAVRIREGMIYIIHKIPVSGIMKISYPFQTDNVWTGGGWTENDIKIGDAEFDRKFLIIAPSEYYIRAFLNQSVRQSIMNVCRKVHPSLKAAAGQTASFELTSGWLKIKGKKEIFNESGKIEELFYDAMGISDNFTNERDLKTRFIENVKSDSEQGVRYYNLQHLGERFGADGDVIPIMEQILEEKSLSMQITAAKYCGKKGMDHLEKILKENKDLDDNYILNIISIFSGVNYTAAIHLLMEIYKNSKNEKIHRDILWAFWKFKDERTTEFLLEQIERSDGDVRLDAAVALGVCGTVASVERMYKAAKNSLNPFFRNQVQKSILQIQGRLGGVEKGWLSVEGLSETDGALSIDTEADEGALTLEGMQMKDDDV